MAVLTYTQVSSLIKYEPETGKLFWLPRPVELFPHSKWGREQTCAAWNARYAGKEALTAPKDGYTSGSLLWQKVRAHRVAWLLYYGDWPTKHIDHINGDRADNRIENLRDVSRSTNQRNQKRRSNNTTGVSGIQTHARGYRVQFRMGGQNRHVGLYRTFSEALAARNSFAQANGYSERHGKAELL